MLAACCAGDHGEATNFLPPLVPGRPLPRRHLAALVEATRLDVDVHLGKNVWRMMRNAACIQATNKQPVLCAAVQYSRH